MKKIETKGLNMSAVYSNVEYSKIYLAWHEEKKQWHAVNRYDDHIEYFEKLSNIR